MARASASRRRGSREAPFGSVSATLAEARAEVEAGVGQRASLLHPSRPVTADNRLGRSLFSGDDYAEGARPVSRGFADAGREAQLRALSRGPSVPYRAQSKVATRQPQQARSGEGVGPLGQLGSAENWGWGVADGDAKQAQAQLHAGERAQPRTEASAEALWRRAEAKADDRDRGSTVTPDQPETVEVDAVGAKSQPNDTSGSAYTNAASTITAQISQAHGRVRKLLVRLEGEDDARAICGVCEELNDAAAQGAFGALAEDDDICGDNDDLQVQHAAAHVAGQSLKGLMKRAGKRGSSADCVPAAAAKLAVVALRFLSPALMRAESEHMQCTESGSKPTVLLMEVAQRLYGMSKIEAHDGLFISQVSPALLRLLAQYTGDGVHGYSSRGSKAQPRLQPHNLDSLIYACAALKNTSQKSEAAQSALWNKGAVARMAAILDCCVCDGSDASACSWLDQFAEDKVAQLLVQVTGVLRNLSVSRKHYERFWEARVVEKLCALLDRFVAHAELVENVCRALAKLTSTEEGRCRVTRNEKNIPNLLRLLSNAPPKRRRSSKKSGKASATAAPPGHNMLVRVGFVLGNLTAGNDENRTLLLAHGAVPQMLQVLDDAVRRLRLCRDAEEQVHQLAEDAEGEEKGSEDDEGAVVVSAQNSTDSTGCGTRGTRGTRSARSSASVNSAERKAVTRAEDLLIKLLRAIANASINAEFGRAVVRSPQSAALVQLLEMANSDSIGPMSEELMLNTVSVVTNLTFYCGSQSSSNSLWDSASDVAGLLVSVLLQPNEEAIVEAARAFGNLSRDASVRLLMTQRRVDELLVLLLGHANRDIVYTACGALINVASDNACLQVLRRPDLETCDKLVGIIRQTGLKDPDLAATAAKLLFNLVLHRTDAEGECERKDAETETEWKDAAEDDAAVEVKEFVSAALLDRLRDTIDELLDMHDGVEQGTAEFELVAVLQALRDVVPGTEGDCLNESDMIPLDSPDEDEIDTEESDCRLLRK